MAKTLADYKKEFAAIQKLVQEDAEEMEGLEHNLDTYREHIVEGFKALGARIAELRAQGLAGTDIAAYQGDAVVAAMLRELQQRREAGKVAGARAQTLYQTNFKALKTRMKTLRDSLTAEIAARQKKISSTVLGINQSVKEMVTLQTEVEAYARGGNNDWTTVFGFAGTIEPKQYVNLYNDLLAEQLNKTAKAVRTDEKLAAAKQRLNDKIMKSAIIKVKAHYSELVKQDNDAKAAQQARAIMTLANAKKAGAAALDKLNALVEPYEAIMKNAKLLKVISESPDKALIQANTKTLFDLKARAEGANDTLQSRRLVKG